MNISLNWLADYIDIAPLKADLRGGLEKLTMRGLEVEAIADQSKGLQNVVAAQVIEKLAHPNASKLSLCKVSDGTQTFQIVCGAQNFKSGDKVVLSKIGAELPNGLKIQASKIRDVESFGMLCSEAELGIKAEAEGILVLPTDTVLGTPIAQVLGRDDVVFTLNITPNRGDALSHVGVARELASILGQPLKFPFSKLAEVSALTSTKLKVSNDDPTGCFQYHGRVVDDVTVKDSPQWLSRRLEACGVRSINNIVDITNYVMLEMGTPLHAFDADLIVGGIQIRRAKEGEKIPLLDGTQATLNAEDLVIADSEKSVAVAGVMGASNSEVSTKTKRIVLEAAEFHYASVRKTSKRLQKHTEASHRFERRIDSMAVARAIDRAAALIGEWAGGKVYQGRVTAMAKGFEETLRDFKEFKKKIVVNVAHLNTLLGLSLKTEEVADALKRAGFRCEGTGDSASGNIAVCLESHRPDVASAEDVYEEVLRVVGYDKVVSRIPQLPTKAESLGGVSSPVVARARNLAKLKSTLASQGFCEAVNFAFTSRAKVEQWLGVSTDAEKLVTISNPLNEEFTTLRTTLFSGLFENLLLALRHQSTDVRLFECRPVYLRDEKSETGVREEWRLAALMTGRSYATALSARDRELDFFDAKAILEGLLDTLGVRGLRLKDISDYPQLHPYQSVELLLGPGSCGVLGRLHPVLEMAEKIRQPVYLFEISLDRLLGMVKNERKYAAIAKFPKVVRDFTFLTPKTMASEKVLLTIQKIGKPLVEGLNVVDVFESDKLGELRALSVSVTFGDAVRTLEDHEIDSMSQKLLAGLEKDLGIRLKAE